MDLPICPAFGDFYMAVNARCPFPWQEKLAARAAEGDWPELVGVETGLGKTACVDIAVWSLAHQAGRAPTERTAPTRLWWVVNRRSLVDDTHRHATAMAEMLADPKAPEAVRAVAARLLAIGGGDAIHSGLDAIPLEALRLRAGESRSRPRHPAQPAVICSTIPMYGSRLLFRGYGSSKFVWSIDAALAGTDSLVIVDEAHIARHLCALIDDLADWAMPPGAAVLPCRRARPRLVQLTATGDAATDRIGIDGKDRAHPVVKQRLAANKPLRIAKSDKPPVEALVDEFGKIDLKEYRRVLVFVNTPRDAVAIADRLRRMGDKFDVAVATGQMRGAEAEATAETVSTRMGAGTDDGERPIVVVATQTLEVGADLDADCLITERCGTRALVQRLGRLNRLGERPHALGVYVECKPREHDIYRDEPDGVLKRLEAEADSNGVVDMSPARAAKVLGEPGDDPGEAPVLPDALLDEWVKTTSPPRGEAPVEPYFSGFSEPSWTVGVAWRLHVPKAGERIWPRIAAEEIVEIGLPDARELAETLSDAEIAAVGHDRQTAEDADPERLWPGSTLILSCTAGGLHPDGHRDTDADSAAVDVSMLNYGLPLSPEALTALEEHTSGPARRILDVLQGDEADTDEVAAAFVDHLADIIPPAFAVEGAVLGRERWQRFATDLVAETRRRAEAGERVVIEPGSSVRRLMLHPRNSASVDASDGLSFLSAEADLDAHGADTAHRAAAIASAAGMPEGLTALVERAARLHDIGKSDTRFQRWLNLDYQPGNRMLAKSNTPRWLLGHHRRMAGYPKGGRHEEHSRRLVASWLTQANHNYDDHEAALLQHLVVSHHGRGRPLLEPANDNAQPGEQVLHAFAGVTATADASLAFTDWSQPARFAALNRRYGRWGLAMMEAVLRQSDWMSSHMIDRANRLEVQ